MLRSPGLPLAALDAPNPQPASAEAEPEARQAWDRETLRRTLRELADRATVREALALASPDLVAPLEAWRSGTLDAAAARGVERALLKYLGRMSHRATPFGLFAGVSLGAWGSANRLEVGAWTEGRKAVRLDWGALETLAQRLEREPEVRAGLRYRPNDSLYARGGWHRYLEARDEEGAGRTYHLEAAEATKHLDLALEEAAAGMDLDTLAAQLADRLRVHPAAARSFLEELVEAQVLRGDLHPPLTGTDPLGHLAGRLCARPASASYAEPLAALARELEALRQSPLGSFPAGYGARVPALVGLDLPASPRDLLQVDLFRPAPGLALSPEVRRALEEGAETLRRLTPAPGEGPLDRFREAFEARYGGRWVPLLEALDEEGGLGFDGASPSDAPLLEGLPFLEPAPARTLTPRDRHLLSQVSRWRPGAAWELTDADLAALAPADPQAFPASFAALATLAAADAEALDRGDFHFWMEQYSGPAASRWLGRFASGDADLRAALEAHLRREEATRPEAVFAEVVHVPEGRMGNVLARPALRPHEIPFLAVPGVPPERTLPPSDLLLAVRDGRVVLASRRLGCEVLPRLSSAHNYARGAGVYRFLAHLQDQDGRPGGWSWGILADLPFLPRVVRGRQVLSRARWCLEAAELQAALAEAGGPWEAFQTLRARRGLPRWVLLTDADQQWRVDLDRVLWVEVLHHLVAGREAFVLTEAYPEAGASPLAGPEGRFAHELVVPFEAPGPARPAVRLPRAEEAPVVRAFPPGSEWLYLKLYGGPAGADRLLAGLGPLLRETEGQGLWDRWHFLRYRDPEPHLRLRLHGRPQDLLTGLLPRLHAHLEAARDQGLLWTWQVDTFEPEWERYGGPVGFPLAEAWFHEDSARLQAFLAAGPDAEGRWREGLRGVDAIWAALGLDLEGREALAGAAREAFRREFGASGPGPAAVGAAFRARRRELEAAFAPAAPGAAGPGFQRLVALREAFEGGRVEGDRSRIAGSLSHLHLNRLFRNRSREQEWILLEFLTRLYDARLARTGRREGREAVTKA